ncbi:DUF1573 domain-containing protein [Lewinella sp. 4G2]|uniref:DUF1573 domain-containing protein n=1 Tax=Lewinella sp. 4G2 TaxID=1803372 RepID=UPI000A709E9A|nr:DUF1573 domain-containing protein [Lewinella sp. 4G2]
MVFRLRQLPILIVCLLLVGVLSHCTSAPAAAPENEVGELGTNASIIRNPVDQGQLDTVNVAKMTFAETAYAFGQVKAGAVVKHSFEFTNDGKVPLLITNARSTCGCTVPSYPEAPIAPGESGVIEVAFDTKNKNGYQEKPVVITANTYPARTTVYVKGRVE